jgi:hypothetical protein
MADPAESTGLFPEKTEMTLAVAWIRRINNCHELVVASDSRLSGGRNFDSCAKIIPLPRSDSFVCCAGDTDITYPLALQIFTGISSYRRSNDRSLDICVLRAHLLKILNAAVATISSQYAELRRPNRLTQLLFGGYSWVERAFRIWRFSYSRSEQKFIYTPAPAWCRGRAPVIFAGDWQWKARARLITLLRSRHGATPQSDVDFYFDWEPFEILRDILREESGDDHSSIGGPPQLVKVYQHMNCKHIGVFWPNKAGGDVTIAGRTILDYERPDCWILDPDTLITSHPYYTAADGIGNETVDE